MDNFKKYLNMNKIYPNMIEKYKEFEKAGKIEKCYKILMPVVIAEVDILQKPVESFEEIEKVILKLVDASVTQKEEIAKLTGIPVNYVQNMISLFITQKLLTDDGTKLTDMGELSLKTGGKHITTVEKRRIQINGITGNIMPKKFQIYENELQEISQMNPNELYKLPTYEMLQVIDESIWDEMKQNVEEYVYIYNETSESNVEKISISQVIDNTYAYAFLIKYENLQQPILISKSKIYMADTEKMEFSYEPLWIYKEDAKYLGIEEKEIIGKTKTNIIRFKNQIEKMYIINEEKVIKYLEKMKVKNVEGKNTYEIGLKGNEYNKDILFKIKYIHTEKSEIPYFPDDNENVNGEVFYFYTNNSKEKKEMDEISEVVCLYMVKVKNKLGSAKAENCKKDNKDIVDDIIKELTNIPEENIRKHIKNFKESI